MRRQVWSYGSHGGNPKGVAQATNNGSLVSSDYDDHFGVTLSFEFKIDNKGINPANNKPMQFSFTGDDDLWVFIDDVLVADLGGIQDTHRVLIDFSTGKVTDKVITSSGRDNETTLKSAFEAAGRMDTQEWDGNRFADSAESHTLKLFYLERGANASNLSMYFNMLTASSVQFPVQKVLDGRDWQEHDEFTFQLEAGENTAGIETPLPKDGNTVVLRSATAKNREVVEGTFGKINFTKAGTYNYVISEVPGVNSSLSYSQDQYSAQVVVEDIQGNLQVSEITYTLINGNKNSEIKCPVFTNTYTASGTTEVATGAQFGLTKHLDGRDWQDGDAFEFALTASDGAPLPENVTATVTAQDGSIDFGAIEFTPEHVGKTYTYTVKESHAGEIIDGITYSSNEAVFEVAVSDNFDGTLSAQVTQTAGDAVFTNTYTASTPATLDTASWNISKTLFGRDWKDSDSFEFVLSGSDGAPMPSSTTAEVDKANKQVSFGAIEFTPEHVGKSFVYTVYENTGDIAGIIYDSHKVEITVTVVDDGEGKVIATATTSGNLEFVNTYTTNEYAQVGLSISNSLLNHDMAAGQFSYKITPADEASTAKLPACELQSGDAAPAAIDEMFSGVLSTISIQDASKTFTYEIEQTSSTQPGYVLDMTKHTVSYEVVDDGEGSLTVNLFLDGEAAGRVTPNDTVKTINVHFENRYDATASLNTQGSAFINAHKSLTGTNLAAGQFNFDVVDGGGNVVSSAANAADGSIVFSTINYNLADLIAAHTPCVDGSYCISYTVVERTDGFAQSGISNTVSCFAITVLVTDNGDGTMTTEVVYPDGASSLEFQNAYNAEGEISQTIHGTKVLSATQSGLQTPDITGKYTFNIQAITEGAPLPTNTSTTNDAASQVNFGDIVFDASYLTDVEPAQDGSRTKVFEYSVTESGHVAGVANDTSVHSFTITLVDDGHNHLSAVASSDNGLFTFTNTYSVDPVDSVVADGISIKKVLKGRELKAGEFEFQMLDAEGNVVAHATNDAEGNVVFADTLCFKTPGIYRYSVSEVVSSTSAGIDYDDAVYEVVAKVTNNLDGTLSVEWSTDQDEMVFTNTYTAAPTQIVLSASKVLEGRELEDAEFSFELVDNQGRVLTTSMNASDGTITFDAIRLVEPGSYTFTIREIAGDDQTITYDDSEFNIVVEVVDDGLGHLVARVVSEDEVVFTNTYTAPVIPPKPADDSGNTMASKPVDKLPVTGDYVALAAAGLGIAGVIAVVLAVIRKKKSN